MRRLLWSLVLLLAAGLPGGAPVAAQAETVQTLPQGDSGMAQCGGYRVSWHNQRSFDVGTPGSASLSATTASGAAVLSLQQPLAPGEVLLPLWCGDLLQDGSQTLAYEDFSGGAHCCFTASLLLLQPSGARPLLHMPFGDGGLNQPAQLDAGGPLEVLASSNVFAYFDDLSFAASPFMPMAFRYDGSQYVEATRQYPDWLQGQIQTAEADLAEAVARGAPSQVPVEFADQAQESVALRLYGLHVLLGDADQALPDIEARVSPPVASWLAAHADEAAADLAAVYDLGG